MLLSQLTLTSESNVLPSHAPFGARHQLRINFESVARESANIARDDITYSPSTMIFVSWLGEITGLCGPSPMKTIRFRNSLPKPLV